MITAKGTRFVDESGRERIFNGVNMVQKYEDGRRYLPLFPPDVLEALQQRGINLIRLGMVWAAVEPAPGQYNESYIAFMVDFAKRCAEKDIYLLLDMHQDLYGDIYEDGAPEWATLADGGEFVGQTMFWGEPYFFSDAVKNAFDNFWANRRIENGEGLLDYYAAMWRHLAKAFADCPNVLGIDLLNEPYPGNAGLEIFLTLINGLLACYNQKTGETVGLMDLMVIIGSLDGGDTTVLEGFLQIMDDKDEFRAVIRQIEEPIADFEREYYLPFYQKMFDAIREASDVPVFWENNYFSNLGARGALAPLRDAQGKPRPQQAFAPHTYDILVDTPLDNKTSFNRLDVSLEAHVQTQKDLAVPVVLGEWGGKYVGSGGEQLDIAHQLAHMEKHLWSHTYWAWNEEMWEHPFGKMLQRAYPQAVCGEILAYANDRETDCFTLAFTQSAAQGESVIYLPKPWQSINAPGAYRTEVLPGGAMLLYLQTVAGQHRLTIQF